MSISGALVAEGSLDSDPIREAVVICTRNRPSAVETVLNSLEAQSGMDRRMALIVDASDEEHRLANQRLADRGGAMRVEYVRFPGKPSLARQRNYSVEHLPPGIEIVHFLDDDVTLAAGCLDQISEAFQNPDVGGAAGRIEIPDGYTRRETFFKRLFLLEGRGKGRVLSSGAVTPGQLGAEGQTFETEWLGGCSSYRVDLVRRVRFDDRLEGYSLDEDLDFSFRAGRINRLVVVPSAIMYHHESEAERADSRRYARDSVVHRYWFVEKNSQHPLRKPAFWWSTAGRILAATLSGGPNSSDVRAGLMDGVGEVRRRSSPLLSREPSEKSDRH